MPTIEEPDLAWLLAPPNETRMGLGVEREVRSLRGVRFPASTKLQWVRLYRDPYGSHRFVGFVAEAPVSGLQVMVNDAVRDAEGAPLTVVANVYTDPDWRRRGAAGDLYTLARRVLGPVRHSRHLSESGARFAARNRAAASTVTFGKFPKMIPGEDDDGASIFLDGVEVGFLQRVNVPIDVGILTYVPRNKIVGYRLDFYGEWGNEIEEVRFKTLAEARNYARRISSLPRNPQP